MDTVDKSFVADKLNRNSCDSSEEQTKFYNFVSKHTFQYLIIIQTGTTCSNNIQALVFPVQRIWSSIFEIFAAVFQSFLDIPSRI